MKKLILSLFLVLIVAGNTSAQTGTVSTVAGCNMCVLTPADGAVATMAEFYESAGIALDASRNVYIIDRGVHKLRRILSSTNLVYTVVGDGVAGFAGDGMTASATGVRLNNPNGLYIDAGNNIYIADEGNGRVRKIDATTGIINTIAGGGASIADGVPATAANLTPRCVYVDAAGNIYTGGNNQLRKINGTTGIITTIAGNGTAADAGDGGPATAAGIRGPIEHIAMDAAGNIYFVSGARNSVRKINGSTGIISTVIGGSACPLGSISGCVVDAVGNVIAMDRANYVIRQWDATNNVTYTIAGGGSSIAEYTPALSAWVHGYRMYMDNAGGNLYFTDSSHWIRKMSYSPSSYAALRRDSFVTSINKLCSGPVLTVNTGSYSSGMTIKTWFGDGTTDITAITTRCSGIAGNAVISHVYNNSGTYTIKQVLYNGTIPLDSMRRSYQHSLCNALYFQYYYDRDGNCSKESTEPNIFIPTLTEIDSNNIPVDTISVTSGAYYTAYGNSGDIYKIKPIGVVGGISPICPSTGFISDTLRPIVYSPTSSMFGMSCLSAIGHNLRVFPSFRVGSTNFRGKIIVDNTLCLPPHATLTMQLSPKYDYSFSSSPRSTLRSGNSVSWDIDTLSGVMNKPTVISVNISEFGHIFGDTVITKYNIGPIMGDASPSDNIVIRCDTVSASHDPNEISVVPGNSCVYSGNKLTYTIHFENTGNDTAFNIHVLDTLSNNLDMETMRIVTASHRMDVIPIHNGGYNILKFDFPDINLLDSSHHNENDGMFIFSINLKNGLADGTQIPNRVGIYFDYNPVVMTNTVTNTIGCPTAVPEIAAQDKVELYPNPAADQLTLKIGNSTYRSYTITNMLGQELADKSIYGTVTHIPVATLPPGMYYLTLWNDEGSKVMKFMKQ